MYGDSMDFAWAPPPQKRLAELPPWGYDRLAPTFAPSAPAPRITLAGSLDPTTGIFYRTPEHPRLRTAQACDKCRTRKAKCSGDHPSCARCLARGLICEYAKEGRVRGPNKVSRSRSRALSASTSPVLHPYSALPTVTTLDAATLEGLGISKPRRRRHSTLAATPLPPLASTRPLALPAPSTGVVAPNPKRLSLPTSLDLTLLPRMATQVSGYNLTTDQSESHRRSSDNYVGEAGYDSYTHSPVGPSKQEAAFLLDAAYHSSYSPHSHHPHYPAVSARNPPALALRTDGLGLGIMRRTSSDDLGVSTPRGSNLRSTSTNSLSSRPSSASESASSQSRSPNPPSGDSVSFPLFCAPYSPQRSNSLTHVNTHSHANSSYSIYSPDGAYPAEGYQTSALQQPSGGSSQRQFGNKPHQHFDALYSKAYSSDGQRQTPSPLSAISAPTCTSSFGSPCYRTQSAHGHSPLAPSSRPHSASIGPQRAPPFAYNAALEMESSSSSLCQASLVGSHSSSPRPTAAFGAETSTGSGFLHGWAEPPSMPLTSSPSSSMESAMGFSVPMPMPTHIMSSCEMSMAGATRWT